jgi:hypothetical protein
MRVTSKDRVKIPLKRTADFDVAVIKNSAEEIVDAQWRTVASDARGPIKLISGDLPPMRLNWRTSRSSSARHDANDPGHPNGIRIDYFCSIGVDQGKRIKAIVANLKVIIKQTNPSEAALPEQSREERGSRSDPQAEVRRWLTCWRYSLSREYDKNPGQLAAES